MKNVKQLAAIFSLMLFFTLAFTSCGKRGGCNDCPKFSQETPAAPSSLQTDELG